MIPVNESIGVTVVEDILAVLAGRDARHPVSEVHP
jgi:hypothetical protein